MGVSLLEENVGRRRPAIVPLTVEQFHRMMATGVLREGDPIELVDGILVYKDRGDSQGGSMHGPIHSRTVNRVQRTFRIVEGLGFFLHSQLPVTLRPIHEPEPDGAVVRGTPDDYPDRHPGPQDIRAIVEVSDSSLEYDRTTKQRIYATASIPVYLIVNLPETQIEVYENPLPAEGRYASRTVHKSGQTIRLTLSATAVVEVAVSDILPA